MAFLLYQQSRYLFCFSDWIIVLLYTRWVWYIDFVVERKVTMDFCILGAWQEKSIVNCFGHVIFVISDNLSIWCQYCKLLIIGFQYMLALCQILSTYYSACLLVQVSPYTQLRKIKYIFKLPRWGTFDLWWRWWSWPYYGRKWYLYNIAYILFRPLIDTDFRLPDWCHYSNS